MTQATRVDTTPRANSPISKPLPPKHFPDIEQQVQGLRARLSRIQIVAQALEIMIGKLVAEVRP
jgi:hypothetical protein